MDVPTLKLVLKPILTVTSVWNTGETSDINRSKKVVSGEKKLRRTAWIWITLSTLKESCCKYWFV